MGFTKSLLMFVVGLILILPVQFFITRWIGNTFGIFPWQILSNIPFWVLAGFLAVAIGKRI